MCLFTLFSLFLLTPMGKTEICVSVIAQEHCRIALVPNAAVFKCHSLSSVHLDPVMVGLGSLGILHSKCLAFANEVQLFKGTKGKLNLAPSWRPIQLTDESSVVQQNCGMWIWQSVIEVHSHREIIKFVIEHKLPRNDMCKRATDWANNCQVALNYLNTYTYLQMYL